MDWFIVMYFFVCVVLLCSFVWVVGELGVVFVMVIVYV